MKILYTLLFLLFSSNVYAQSYLCPSYIHIIDSTDCNWFRFAGSGINLNSPTSSYYTNLDTFTHRVCQNSIINYTIQTHPISGVSFTIDAIVVTGGILLSNTNTSYSIQWGSGSLGIVDISFHTTTIATGSINCNKSVTTEYTLVPNPVAAFTSSPNPSCFNSPSTISFNSSSSIGAIQYFWDFGDGASSTEPNPTHSYTSPGLYNVCLHIGSEYVGHLGQFTSGSFPENCRICNSTVCHSVEITNLPAPDIACVSTVCANTLSTYCTSALCSNYNWVVTGGVITSGNNSACITVQWGSGNTQGNLHLDVPGCSNYCPQGTDIAVPIIPATANIAGESVVCLNTTSAYILPTFAGTTYSWSISGGQAISGNNTNTVQIKTMWNAVGTYTVNCVYFDSSLNCGGTATTVVQVLPQMNIAGASTQCPGDISVLQSSLVQSPYTNVNCNWSVSPAGATIIGSTTGSSVTIHWILPGTYTIVATPISANQVCAPSTYQVTVYSPGVISDILGPDSICINVSSVYSVESNVQGTYYSWSVTGGNGYNLVNTGDSIQVDWNSIGPYSISVTQYSNTNNCSSYASFSKTLYAYVDPIVQGANNVCVDNIESYTVANSGISNFTWRISPPQFGTIISSPNSNPVQIKWHGNNNPGGSNIVYLHYEACKDDSIAITISEPIEPVITATGSLCPNGVTLSCPDAGSFQWTCIEHPISPLQSSTSSSITVNQEGHYTLEIQNQNGTGCNVSAVYNVPKGIPFVAQINASAKLNYCLPDFPNMSLSATSGVGLTYQWYQNSSLISGATNSIYNVNAGSILSGSGIYHYYCIIGNGLCFSTSNLLTVTIVSNCAIVGGGGCVGSWAIANISGCNPFVISSSLVNGEYIIPGSMVIEYLEDGLTSTGNTSRIYSTIGEKHIKVCVSIKMIDSSICYACIDTSVIVKASAVFIANIYCNTVSLIDNSSAISPFIIASHNWTLGDYPNNNPTPLSIASFDNNSLANPILTFTQSGTFIITHFVTTSGISPCIFSQQDTVIIDLPNADFTSNIFCAGTLNYFTNLFPGTTNYWNFGDGSSSIVSPTFHTYESANNYSVVHTIKDEYGCRDTVTKIINIAAAPTCTINYLNSTSLCSNDSLELFACSGYLNYQWKKNGIPISGATNDSYFASELGSYSFTAVDLSGCKVISDTVYVGIIPAPKIGITFNGNKCEGEPFSYSIPLCSSCYYYWEIDGNMVQDGLSNTLAGTAGFPPFTAGTHQIKVYISDNWYGCFSIDSAMITFDPQPNVSINVTGNPALLCSNNSYQLNAVTTISNPIWEWTYANFNSILSSSNTFTTSSFGTYNVKLTDGTTGCSTIASQNILESPNLTLFPTGCDTLCQNSMISLPLPSFNGDISGYTITWHDNISSNSTIVGTGISLHLSSLSLGAHAISVEVVGPNGCSNISNIYYINIVSGLSSSITVSACSSYTWALNATTYTSSGIYTNVSTNAFGCDIIDTLILTISQSSQSTLSIINCNSFTWNANGATYTTSGTYTYTNLNANSCPQYYTLNLVILYSNITSSTISACGQYTWPVNGVTYTTSGTYTSFTINGFCISSHTLILTITQDTTTSQTVLICDMYTWPVNGITYTNSGVYSHTSINSNGCVHTSILDLTILYTTVNTTCISACGSYTWPINGLTYTNSCTQTDIQYSSTACPIINVLCLTILPSITMHDTIVACDNYLWAQNGVAYTSSGVYSHSFTGTNGCLYQATLHLTILNSTNSTNNIITCNNYTWPVNGVTYTTSGIYTVTSINAQGCPHTSTLYLTKNNGIFSTINITACDAYTWHGTTYTQSGIYTYTNLNTNGCLETTSLNLTINHSSAITIYVSACGSYTWNINGITYTNSGTYTNITVGSNGCPLINILCLTICQESSTTISISACNSYTWLANGITYTSSGVYTTSSINSCGCVMTSTLNLNINYSTNTSNTVVACDTYTWPFNGITYTNSGIYTYTSLSPQGCINISSLILTIDHSLNSNINIIACDEYFWNLNGMTYTNSGVFTYTYQNQNGCIQSSTLNLTIHHSTNSISTIIACDSYTWPLNGLSYSNSGNYTYTYLNAENCLHTSTLQLTINNSSGSTTSVFACDAYFWNLNGQVYNNPGVYTASSTNTNGCVHIDTLLLNLGNTSIVHIFDTACCSYTWNMNGVTYTESGIYQVFTTGNDGCPQITILCVTIYPCLHSVSSIIACGTYIWNGVTYTTSGLYTQTLLNNYGCPYTDTLYLTIGNIVTTTSTCDTVCDTYTWPLNGVTYTSSGVYTHLIYDSLGCPHIYIRCITILHHSNSDTSITAVGAYTWALNGITYTNSGIYTATILNAEHCDSIITLHLTITIPSGNVKLAIKVLLSGPYQISTAMMHDSLRVKNLIPLNEPYSASPYNKLQLLGGGGEATTASVLSNTGNNAIVDWIYIEIRSPINCSTIVATKNALLQRDGDIVSTDGFSPLSFPLLPYGNYYIGIKHRNHLGVMTASTVSLFAGLQTVDFTSIPLYTIATITNAPTTFAGPLKLLWSGDANYNKNIKYNGALNDKDAILNIVGISTPNNIITAYRPEDVNLDGKVMYNNIDNDKNIILSNVGILTPNKVLHQHTPN